VFAGAWDVPRPAPRCCHNEPLNEQQVRELASTMVETGGHGRNQEFDLFTA